MTRKKPQSLEASPEANAAYERILKLCFGLSAFHAGEDPEAEEPSMMALTFRMMLIHFLLRINPEDYRAALIDNPAAGPWRPAVDY